MNRLEPFIQLPESKIHGIVELVEIPLKVAVADDYFLHVGGSPSPLTEKKLPVMKVNGLPYIPASSFKGAFRYQAEQIFIREAQSLKAKFKVENENSLKPCIPSARPSAAERSLKEYRREAKGCEVSVEERGVNFPRNGICPVCYLFGAMGLPGFLRIPNFFPGEGEHCIDQTNIRNDRKTQTVAPGATFKGEQVKPKTIFTGVLRIVKKDSNFEFGRPRKIDGEKVADTWLEGLADGAISDVQRCIINEVLVPALNNVTLLGGQKSKGAGDVEVSLGEREGGGVRK